MSPSGSRFRLILGIALACTVGPRGAASQPPPPTSSPLATRPDKETTQRRPHEVVVRFKPNVQAPARAAARAAANASLLQDLRFMNTEQLHVQGITVDDAITRLRSNPNVAYAEPNYVIRALNTPNDPLFPQLYGMHNTGQTGGTPGADIHATQAWDLFTGDQELKVGVIDSGIDYNHPDLIGNIWTNPGEIPGNGVDDDANGYIDDVHGYDFVNFDGDPFDDNGHGTHVSGTIAATGNNGVGVVGVNWHARIIGIKFLDAAGFGSTASAIASVGYAVAVGARLTNNSWGGGPFSQGLLDAINAAGAAGQLFVAAAGNSGVDIDVFPAYPAAYPSPFILSVAATTHHDVLAGFSNFGAVGVDLAAPGNNILSTLPGGGYGIFSGTSMAAPHVTGAVAFTLARFPGLSAMQAKALVLARVDTLSSLAGKVATGGRLNLFAAVLEPDSIRPAPITSLHQIDTGSNNVTLAWTASGDDSLTGRAARYELRYSTSPITAGNFQLAVPAPAGTPGPAGDPDSAEVKGLVASTTYYFAIKSLDELANASAISNIASATTLPPPDIGVTPASFTQTLLVGTTATQTLTVRNDGPGVLDFAIPDPNAVFSQQGVREHMALGKHDPDPRVGSPVVLGYGGPDAFGYRWADSDEPTGPTFSWVDITGVGQPVPIGGDDSMSQPIALGMNFPYYGQTYTSVRVCSNGFITFTGVNPDYVNQPLPTPFAPPALIAPFWDDLVLTSTQIYTHFDGTRFIVTWDGIVGLAGGGPYTFQAILNPSGEIRFQYLSMQAQAFSQTVGIQNHTGDTGLTIAFNAPYVHNGLAVAILKDSPWLDVSPRAGRLHSGEQAQLTVTFDAHGVLGGDHASQIRVLSNDPDEATVIVPATLHAIGAPDIAVSPISLGFGNVFVGATATRTLQVTNAGTDLLTVSAITTGTSVLSATPSSFTLPPNSSIAVTVSFSPTSAAALNTQVVVTSDDPDQPTVAIPVSGAGVLPPDIAVAPDSLAATVAIPGGTTQTFTIQNTGFSPLLWAVDIQAAPSATGARAPAQPLPNWGQDARIQPPTTILQPAGTGPLVTLPVIIQDPLGDGGTVDVTTLRGRSGVTFLELELNLSTPLTPTNFGGYVSLDVDRNPSTGFPPSYGLPEQDIGMEYEVLLFNVELGFVSLYSIESGFVGNFPATLGPQSVRFQIPLFFIGEDDGEMDVTGVVGTSVTPTDWFPNAGHGLVGGASWLSTFPDSGIVPAGQSRTVTVAYDTEGLLGGVYRALVTVASNDPDESEVVLPVRLNAIGVPDVQVVPTALDFGSLFLGQTRDLELLISNEGSAPLSLSGPTVTGAFQALPSGLPTVLGPGDSANVTMRFASGALCAPCAGQVSFTTNDPDENPLAVALTGSALPAPDVAVSPDSFAVSLLTGQTANRTLHITNPGPGTLEWRVTTRGSVSSLAMQSAVVHPVETDPPGAPSTGGPGNRIASQSAMMARVVYASAVPGGPRLLLYDDQVNQPPGQMDSDVALQRLGLGYTAYYSDPTGFGNALTTGAWDIVIVNHTNFYAVGQWWGALESFIQGGGRALISTFDIDGSHSTPTTLWNTLGVVPVGDPATASPVYWWNSQHPVFSYPESVPQFTALVNIFSDHGDRVRTASGTVAVGGFDPAPTVNGGAIVLPTNGRVIVNSFVLCENTSDLDNDGMRDAAELLENEISALGTVDWLSATPESGTLPSGQSVDLTVHFDAADLLGGDYTADLVVTTNAPAHPEVLVRSRLHVTGVPDIQLEGAPVVVTSSIDYITSGAQTSHSLVLTTPPPADGEFELKADGDYGDQFEQAYLTVEGQQLGVVGQLGSDCLPAIGTFPVDAATLAAFASDGVIQATVVNTPNVDTFCPTNQHRVSLRYRLGTTALNFGSLFIDQCRPDSIMVVNRGTDLLVVSSAASSQAAFVVTPSSFSVPAGASQVVLVSFCPTSPGPINGVLAVQSNDPDTPSATAALTGTGLVPPDINVNPTQVVSTLGIPGTETRHVSVQNLGGSDLHFDLGLGTGAAARVPTYSMLELKRGEPDPRSGILGNGGPDHFGYRWKDSDEPNGPTFQWVDITQTGTRLPFVQLDQNITNLPIGFPFKFYGSTFTSINACTHGWLSFTSPIVAWGNQPLPNPGAPENLLAAFWDDLNIPAGGEAWYESTPSRFVLSYLHVPRTQGGGPMTFQVVLYPSGEIIYQYLSMGLFNNSATIGIQNFLQDDGLTTVFDAPYVHDGLAVRFSATPDWLTVTPEGGVVPAGQSADLQFVINTAGLTPDNYLASVGIRSNDPDEGLVNVAVALSAGLEPDIQVGPSAVDFGRVFLGQHADRLLTVSNTGGGVLSLTGAHFAAGSNAAFQVVAGVPAVIGPGTADSVTLRFAPSSACSPCTGTLILDSNDPDENPLSVSLSATAAPPPVAGASPAALVAAAATTLGPTAQVRTKTLTLTNTGGSELEFHVAGHAAPGSIPLHAGLALPRATADPRPGILGSGGPDVFGYRWRDSDEPAGPTFSWVDITYLSPLDSLVGDDMVTGPIDMGMDFPFYGTRHRSVYVCTNGFLSFTDAIAPYTNQPLPTLLGPSNLVAPFWDDLLVDAPRVYAGQVGSRFVVSWVGVRHYNGPGPYTFQAVLYPSGEIRFQYLAMALSDGATAGIQNLTRDDGLTVAFNHDYIRNGLAVAFTVVPRWLSVTPADGTVPPGGSRALQVSMNAEGLADGDHEATLELTSNDPARPLIEVGARLHVGVQPIGFDLDPITLNMASQGHWVSGDLEFPTGFDPHAVDASTLLLQHAVPPDLGGPIVYSDQDHDGLLEVRYKFDRRSLIDHMQSGSAVPVEVMGELRDITWFRGVKLVRALPPQVPDPPDSAATFVMGSPMPVQWVDPSGYPVQSHDLWFSPNGGITWQLLAGGLTGTSYTWMVVGPPTTNAIIALVTIDAAGAMGSWFSDVFRIVATPAAVAASAPARFELRPVGPSPARGSVPVELAVPSRADVEISIFDVRGRLVSRIASRPFEPGWHRIAWDARDASGVAAPPGVYFVRMTTRGHRLTERVALLR